MAFLYHLFLIILQFSMGISVDEKCFSSVWAHRDPQSLLPSIHPFCLLKQTNEVFENIKVIETIDEMEAFIQQNHLERRKTEISQTTYNGILRYSDGSPFLVPLKTFSPKCVGEVTVEISKNIKTSCLIPWLDFNQSYCEENTLINAQKIFDRNLTISEDTDSNMSVPITSYDDLLAPNWNARDHVCENVLIKSNLQIKVGRKNEILSAILQSLRYSRVNAENFQSISTSFEVNFVENEKNEQVVVRTDDEYVDGDAIGAKNDHDEVYSWMLYDVGGCFHSTEKMVHFKRELSVGCEIRETSCETLEQITSSLLQTLPVHLLVSPNSTETVPVIRRNQTVEINTGGSDFRCFLPSVISVDVAFARVGTKDHHLTKIVGAYVNVQTIQVDLETTPKFFVTRKINFKDVTKPASYRFAVIPKIDLRLPSDFFYPLIRNSENAQTIHILIISLPLMLFIYLG